MSKFLPSKKTGRSLTRPQRAERAENLAAIRADEINAGERYL